MKQKETLVSSHWFMKLGIVVVLLMLIGIYLLGFPFFLTKTALPFQPCGGSISNAKKCLIGSCQHKIKCFGCGGTCSVFK